MARVLYCHPSLTAYGYHVFTDLDFWDARRLLKGLAQVRRNFGKVVSGDEFPTQVVTDHAPRRIAREIEKRLKRAIASPPRHVIVRSMIFNGYFEFDPLQYYPREWSRSKMMFFTYRRLPLDQAALSTPYQTARLTWSGENIRIDRVQRGQKYDPVIRTLREARNHLNVPSCF